ncbi:MAG: hypothetical protein QOD42_1867 [Sphingomonadales bacterium]|jgi:hypothetical protein|nr:hypothetical protein [Sphingomonadales bacterium]
MDDLPCICHAPLQGEQAMGGMMRRYGALLALALAGCGVGANNSAAAAAPGADAAREKAIPCSVQAHGMAAVIGGPRERPERPACDDSVDPQRLALGELIRIIPDQHPSFYYILASRLFAANRKDEAVLWFYAGQLRYRIRLACHPDLAPDTEPALFGSLQETVGRQINEYAGADPRAWAATMERALAWDAATRNGFEPKAPCRAAIADQRGGMSGLIAHVRNNEAQLRRDRAAAGLPNR